MNNNAGDNDTSWPVFEILEPAEGRSPVGTISGEYGLRIDSVSPMRRTECGSDVLLTGGQYGKSAVFVREGTGWRRAALTNPAGEPLPDPVTPLKWNARGEALWGSYDLWRNGKRRPLTELGAPARFSAAVINKNGWIIGTSWSGTRG